MGLRAQVGAAIAELTSGGRVGDDVSLPCHLRSFPASSPSFLIRHQCITVSYRTSVACGVQSKSGSAVASDCDEDLGFGMPLQKFTTANSHVRHGASFIDLW